MTQLNDDELAAVLKESVPEPPDDFGQRAERARDEARRIRVRRRAAVVASAVLVAALAGVPAVLSYDGRPGPLTGPAGSPGAAAPASPTTCVGSECDTTAILAAVRKPLALPTLAAGEPCPVSPARRFPPGAGFSYRFSAVGPGPLYLTGPASGEVDLSVGVQDGSGPWREQKVIWAIDGSYAGPLLLRGARIDAPGELRFDRYIGAAGYGGGAGDSQPHASLLYPRNGLGQGAASGVQSYPSGIFVERPGCYAIQVDGEGFSETLVFSAVG